jgi:uncharacterized protein (TIGR02466 family)
MIQDIFKVGVYKEKLIIDNEQLEKYSYSLREKGKQLNKSNKGGYHSDNLNKEDLELQELLKNILLKSNLYSKHTGYEELTVDNIWCNINSYKDFNELHCHPNSKISGVYYVKTPKDCGEIEFHNPAYHVLAQSGLSRSNNNYTSLFWWLPAEKGMLYLFPSWLMHLVRPNMNKEEERISFSFNLS